MRRRQLRNFMATLLLSQGVPMICGGDEFARTQKGNNNAYCQDNEISWFSWERTERQQQLTTFVAELTRMRAQHPIFRRPKFFQGRPLRGTSVKDILWLNPAGKEMTDEEWGTHFVKTIGLLLNGEMTDVRDWQGQPIRDDTFLLLLNASPRPIHFAMPKDPAITWQTVLDTREETGLPKRRRTLKPGQRYNMLERSLVLLKRIG